MQPYENALAERMNRTLKEEFLQYYYFNHEQANKAVARAIKLYNNFRPHLSLDYLTPDQVYYDSEMKRLANPSQLTFSPTPSLLIRGHKNSKLLATPLCYSLVCAVKKVSIFHN